MQPSPVRPKRDYYGRLNFIILMENFDTDNDAISVQIAELFKLLIFIDKIFRPKDEKSKIS